MFEAADIREWRGHDVVDAEGHKIGELEAVYVDTGTDLPSFGTVEVGLPTRHRLVFVPARPGHRRPGLPEGRLRQEAGQDAPSIGTDGELPAGDRRPSSGTTACPTSRAPAASAASPAADADEGTEDPMIALFLLLVIAAIALGIVGVVAKGLLYLLLIGIAVFLGALTLAALRMRRPAPAKPQQVTRAAGPAARGLPALLRIRPD